MKKLTYIFLTMLCIFSLTACGNSSDPSQNENDTQKEPTVSLTEIKDKMTEAVLDLPEMTLADASDSELAADLFAQLSSFDYGKVEDFFYLSAANQSETKSAEELAVIVLKDSYDAADALASVKEHVNSRRLTFESYEPELVPMIKRAEVFDEGKYIVMIIAKNEDEVKKAFYGAIGRQF